MAHKTRVSGTNYSISGGKCRVSGTNYSISKGRTKVGGTGYDISFAPDYDPVFANNTWETIVSVCQSGNVPDTWEIGDQKDMTINGVSYPVDIIGKNHDIYSGGGYAPITFQLRNCLNTAYEINDVAYSNVEGWENCSLRTTDLPAILDTMPDVVKNAIREVSKKTSIGNDSTTIKTTYDKLFLLSEKEITGTYSNTVNGEGSQYAFYVYNGVGFPDYTGTRCKLINGTSTQWWTRSPATAGNRNYCLVYKDGETAKYYGHYAYGISPAFCF